MSNDITEYGSAINLPVAVRNEIRQLTTSPESYLSNLPIERIEDMPPATAVYLSQFRRGLTRAQQLMYLSLMIKEVNDFFNVKGKMTAQQIKLTAELILDNDSFYDLTLGNIKACFRECMITEKLYDRLDGNIIIGWLRKFKSDLADHCENVNIGREQERQRNESRDGAGAISHATYMAMLEARANDGDMDARRTLDEIRRRTHVRTPEQIRQEEMDYRRFKAQYLKKKGIIK